MAQPYSVVKAALDAAVAASGGKFQPFDAKYYVQTYSVVKNDNGSVVDDSLSKFGGDPLQHYVEQGAAKGFKPNAWFDPTFYRAQYPDTQTLAEGDLLVHYAKFGVNEGRAPSTPLAAFDGARYLRDNPDVAAYVNANLPSFGGSVTNGAIAHYVKFGANEGRKGFNVTGGDVGFTTYAPSYAFESSTGTAAADSVTLNLNTNDGKTMLTGSNAVIDGAGGADTLRLIGDADARIDLTNSASQLRGVDLNGSGAIESNGVENNVSGAQKVTVKNFEIVDAYARNPLMPSDMSKNYTGDISFDGTGYYGDGVSSNGNIFLGGLGNDTALGGIGNDFLAGGGSSSGDNLSGGRNADFFFAELSQLDKTDGNGANFDGGTTADNTSAGNAQSTQDADWLLLEASDDDEPVTIVLDEGTTGFGGANNVTTASGQGLRINDIENLNASGNLYGILNDVEAQLGGRSTDARSTAPVKGTENYGIGSTAQLNITGSSAANIIIAGFDNDLVDGDAGNDLLIGGDLEYLLRNKNNPNLIDANGGLKHSNSRAGNVVDGVDSLTGGAGNDNIVFEMDGGIVAGGTDSGTTSGDAVKVTGDTLWLTNFSMGRVAGATAAGETTAQDTALANVTTDSTVRIDLGNDGAANFKNYGGSNAATQDQTNYKTGTSAVTMTAMESVIATGLGAIDYKAAGSNSPELQFSNQQNYKAINADLDLRGNDEDNTLYANTGEDIIEGRGGDDNLSGGTDDDAFVFQYGDGVDVVHRQKDANGDNLWDADATTGAYLYTQDFRAPQQGDISSSRLVVDFGSTDLTSANVAVTSFFLKIGGTSFNVTDVAALAAAKSATALAAVVNAAYNAQDSKVTVVAVGNSLVVTDTAGRDISDTVPEGFAVAGVVGNSSFQTTATFTPGGTPTNIVEDDILVFKTYDERGINLGMNETTNEINNANQLVAKFDTTGTQLAEGQEYLVRLTDVREGDTVSVNINGKVYSYTAKAGENSENARDGLIAVINNEMDINSASGRITAANGNATEPLFPGNGTTTSVLKLDQTAVDESRTYMNLSVTLTNTLTGSASGSSEIHNQSNTHIDLVGFDGRNGNLDGDDVLFLGRTANSVSLLQTALNAGETITGKDATDDQDTALSWINGDDLLIGGTGNDTINGGTGDDRIMVSAGTDTVNGGGNVTENGTTVAFTDVLQAEEGTFGTGSRFRVTLDGTLGALGAGTLLAQDSNSATVGTTTFSQIETVRVLENSRASTLDVQTLSNNVATAVGANVITGTEGLTVNLTRTAPSVNYTIDGDNSGGITAGAGLYEASTGDYNAFEATQVYGVENVVTGNANDTVNMDESQVTAANRIEAGSQQDNATTLAEGVDTVVYNDAAGVLDAVNGTVTTADNTPNITVKVEAAANTDEVSMTGGVLSTATVKDTLVDVEVINLGDWAENYKGDVLDLSAMSGATVGFGATVDVKKSLGGDATTVDTVAENEAETLENGGISVTGSGLGNEKLEIDGITELETITGSAGDDRVVVGDAGLNNQESGTDVAMGRASVLGAATALVAQNVGLYKFNLAGGTNDIVDYFNASDDIGVSVDTTATGNHLVMVDDTAGGGLDIISDAEDRVDSVTGVERFYGANDAAAGINAIDLVGATVATTIQFSKESDDNSNEVDDPNGDDADGSVDLVRGAEVRDTANNTVFARFMDRTATNPTGAAYWDTVYGSATLAETVVVTDNETDTAHTFVLGGGQNVVDYTARTGAVTAAIQDVDQVNNTQSVTADGDTITVAYASYAAGEKTLTVKGSGEGSDTVDISDLDAGGGAATIDSYNLVDLQSGVVVEDVLSTTAADEQGKVIYVTGFEDIIGSDSIDRLYGDGSVNGINGGAGNDWIMGRGGRGTTGGGPAGDQLTGGAGSDRFIYEAETDSATDLAGALTDESQDTVVDFAAADALVFNTTDAGVVKSGAAVVAVTDGGAGLAFQVQIDQNGDGDTADAADDDYTIISTTAAMEGANIIFRVSQSSGQDIQYLSNDVNDGGAVDGQFEIVYTAASQSNNLALPDEFHELELNSADDTIGASADKFDLRSFNFGSFTGDATAGNAITAPDDLDDDGISDLIQDIIYSQPVTVNSLTTVANFFREGAVSSGAHRAVHVQLEPGDNNDFRVFVDVNRDGDYTQADDLVFDLVDVQDDLLSDGLNDGTSGAINAITAGTATTEAALYDDTDGDGADAGDNGIFIFTDGQYNLWF